MKRTSKAFLFLLTSVPFLALGSKGQAQGAGGPAEVEVDEKVLGRIEPIDRMETLITDSPIRPQLK